MKKILIYICFSLFLWQIVDAQNNPTVRALIDTTRITIGDQTGIVVQAKLKGNNSIIFPKFKDTICNEIEIIATNPIDTVNVNGTEYLSQRYTITAFTDSVYYLKPFMFVIDNDTMLTNRLSLQVSMVRMDSTELKEIDTAQVFKIFDIKKPFDAPWTFSEFWNEYGNIILLTLLVLAIIAVIAFIIYRKIKNKPIIVIEKPREPVDLKALRLLNELKNKKLWQDGRIKEYHSELTEIVRQFIEDRYKVPALERTSHEILNIFKQNKLLNQQSTDVLKQILLLADMVKFAKSVPLPDENDLSLQNAILFVETNRPVIVVEQKNISTNEVNQETK